MRATSISILCLPCSFFFSFSKAGNADIWPPTQQSKAPNNTGHAHAAAGQARLWLWGLTDWALLPSLASLRPQRPAQERDEGRGRPSPHSGARMSEDSGNLLLRPPPGLTGMILLIAPCCLSCGFPPSQELLLFLHSLLKCHDQPHRQSREWAVGGGVGNGQVAHTPLHPSQLPCLCGLWQTPTSQPERPSLGPTASPAHSGPEHQMPAKIM